MSIPISYYGSPDPLPRRRELRAGPLTVIYEAGDLRYIQVGGYEVVRRWYAAIRDRNWGTIPGIISNEVVEESNQGFSIHYTSTHQQNDIHFVWQATISGNANGTIQFAFDGEAKSTFHRNRIGFCILHPIKECAEAKVILRHPDRTKTETSFPEFIAPQNPFKELSALEHEFAPGQWVEWQFVGDLFETEDQRNWIDASYKTFCTPLRIPFPVEISQGTRIHQEVILRIRSPIPISETSSRTATFQVGSKINTLPDIGLVTSTESKELTPKEVEVLRSVPFSHLRIDLELWEDKVTKGRFLESVRTSNLLDIPLEVGIAFSEGFLGELDGLLDQLLREKPKIKRWLLFERNQWCPSEQLIQIVRDRLRSFDPVIPLFAGTLANFTELNRNRPNSSIIDGVCYSVQPQEHAFDNASLIECCATLRDTIQSARQFVGNLPIAVTPITLKKRFNPYATALTSPTPEGELPNTVDPRQMSLFGAGWTLGALKYLSESGTASVTLYETIGWRGVMERKEGSILPNRFPSKPEMVFPLFHVLADINEFAGAEVLTSNSSQPLKFDGMTLRKGGSQRILLANMTKEPQSVTIEGLPPQASIRTLDEKNCDRATFGDPLGFREDTSAFSEAPNGRLTLNLNPYAYLRIDSL
jgi:hypothetical protein